ncbi:MAG: hypothetical protein ACJ8BW_00950 [Ktedonobacteraceae bacterium]
MTKQAKELCSKLDEFSTKLAALNRLDAASLVDSAIVNMWHVVHMLEKEKL